RGSNDRAHPSGPDSILYPRNLPRRKSLEPLQFALARRVVLKKFAGQAHGSERQAHRIPDLSLPRKRELAASAAEVQQQNAVSAHPASRDNAEVNEAGLFQSGNDFDRPARRRAYPLQKYA